MNASPYGHVMRLSQSISGRHPPGDDVVIGVWAIYVLALLLPAIFLDSLLDEYLAPGLVTAVVGTYAGCFAMGWFLWRAICGANPAFPDRAWTIGTWAAWPILVGLILAFTG